MLPPRKAMILTYLRRTLVISGGQGVTREAQQHLRALFWAADVSALARLQKSSGRDAVLNLERAREMRRLPETKLERDFLGQTMFYQQGRGDRQPEFVYQCLGAKPEYGPRVSLQLALRTPDRRAEMPCPIASVLDCPSPKFYIANIENVHYRPPAATAMRPVIPPR